MWAFVRLRASAELLPSSEDPHGLIHCFMWVQWILTIGTTKRGALKALKFRERFNQSPWGEGDSWTIHSDCKQSVNCRRMSLHTVTPDNRPKQVSSWKKMECCSWHQPPAFVAPSFPSCVRWKRFPSHRFPWLGTFWPLSSSLLNSVLRGGVGRVFLKRIS